VSDGLEAAQGIGERVGERGWTGEAAAPHMARAEVCAGLSNQGAAAAAGGGEMATARAITERERGVWFHLGPRLAGGYPPRVVFDKECVRE